MVGGVVGVVELSENSGSTSNCVALNPSVKATYYDFGLGRVVGASTIESLSNNFANNSMTTNGGSPFPSGSGTDHVNGADCEAMPLASWWTTAPPNGPGWSPEHWSFKPNELPKLKWEK
jgi:hypothetical protein